MPDGVSSGLSSGKGTYKYDTWYIKPFSVAHYVHYDLHLLLTQVQMLFLLIIEKKMIKNVNIIFYILSYIKTFGNLLP